MTISNTPLDYDRVLRAIGFHWNGHSREKGTRLYRHSGSGRQVGVGPWTKRATIEAAVRAITGTRIIDIPEPELDWAVPGLD